MPVEKYGQTPKEDNKGREVFYAKTNVLNYSAHAIAPQNYIMSGGGVYAYTMN